jgi:hypothetical protein
MQTRRLRMTAESSVGRESFTCVSRLLQLGQRIDQLRPNRPTPSLPGSTRQSILSKKMDARVKPAHDAESVEAFAKLARRSIENPQ